MRYELGLNVDDLVAIDTHVHIEIDDHGHTVLTAPLVAAASSYFRASSPLPTLDKIAEHYRERKIGAVVFAIDARTNLGHAPISSAEIAEGAARNADVLIPFGSIDPIALDNSISAAQRLVDEAGVRGFKFHPTLQGFDPSAPEFWPLFEALQKIGLPLVFHTGQTGIGAGIPGGSGLKLAYSNPILLDAVAASFPALQIIMAHPSVPWQDEALAVATHKVNTWIDLSGWSPKYFPQNLLHQANSLLQDRVLFGSDYPLIDPDRWLSDFESLDIKDSIRPKILKQNAARLLGLSATS